MRRQPTETDLVMLAALPSSAGHWHPGLQGQELVQVVRGMSCNMGRYADRGLQIWRQGLQQPESGWTPPANAPMTTTRSHLAASLLSSNPRRSRLPSGTRPHCAYTTEINEKGLAHL